MPKRGEQGFVPVTILGVDYARDEVAAMYEMFRSPAWKLARRIFQERFNSAVASGFLNENCTDKQAHRFGGEAGCLNDVMTNIPNEVTACHEALSQNQEDDEKSGLTDSQN